MIKVWILLVIIHGGNGTTDTVVVDNIASKAECSRIQDTFNENTKIEYSAYTRCIQVNKVKGN
jgi:hypothetical protein